MPEVLTTAEVTEQLTDRFAAINVPEPALVGGAFTQAAAAMVASQVTAGILAAVTQFLADNADLLPPKQAVLDAVNKAIDAALKRINKPLLTALISRTVKNLIANAVDSLYDAILNPPVSNDSVEV